MSRLKVFLDNIFIYGGIQSLNKLIPFIALPIIIYLLGDSSSYGYYDMFVVVSSLGANIGSLGMFDAVFREYFANKERKISILSTAFFTVLICAFILGCIFVAFNNSISKIIFNDNNSGLLVVFCGLSLLFMSTFKILVLPARLENDRKLFFYSNLLTVGLSNVIGIVLLLVLKTNNFFVLVYSYLFAYFVGSLYFYFRFKNFFILKNFSLNNLKNLLVIGLPLVPVFIFYWVFQSISKVFLINISGASVQGIYSATLKLSSISSIFQLAFASGWSYFTFSTMNDADQKELKSKIFHSMSLLFLLAFLAVFPFSKFIFTLLFPDEFVIGYKIFPFLFLSPLLLILYQIIGNQFTIHKKSYLSTLVLGIGGAINIGLNYLLINSFSLVGAAIATVISYFVILFLAITITLKKSYLTFSNQLLILPLIVLIMSFINYENIVEVILIDIFLILVVIFIFRRDIGTIIKTVFDYKTKYFKNENSVIR